jgi:AcrR family transcriptional regulator
LNRRQAILDTATRLFAENGFHNTSTQEIAETAGVAHGTLFYHFKNKEGIIYEIFKHAGAFYTSRLQEAADAPPSGIEKIVALLDFNTAFSRSHSQQLLIFLRDFPDKMTAEKSPLKELVRSTGKQVVDVITGSIETGMADGSIRRVDSHEIAHVINALMYGLVHINLLNPLEPPDLEESAADFCRTALAPPG